MLSCTIKEAVNTKDKQLKYVLNQNTSSGHDSSCHEAAPIALTALGLFRHAV